MDKQHGSAAVSSLDGDADEIISGGTRREVLARFAALSLAGFVGLPVAASRAATGALSSGHVATFRALAEAYSQLPAKLGVPARADLLADLRAKLAAGDETLLQYVKATLEALEVASEHGRFSQLPVADRRSALRKWRVLPIPFDRHLGDIPRDKAAVDDLRKENERLSANIRAFQSTLPPEQLRIDPATMLPAFTPPPPTDAAFAGPGEGPLVTENQQLQHLASASFSLISALYFEDPRRVTDVVI